MKSICVVRIIICGLLMAFVYNVCGIPSELAREASQGAVGDDIKKETTVEGKKPPKAPKEVPASETPKKIVTTEGPKESSIALEAEAVEEPEKTATTEGPKEPPKAPKDVPPKKTITTEAPKALPKETPITSPELEGSFGDGNENTTSTPNTNTTTKKSKKNQADKGIVMNLLNLAIIMASGRILAM